MDNYLSWLPAVPLTGVSAGSVTALAGSGSLITLPMPILVGLPAHVATRTATARGAAFVRGVPIAILACSSVALLSGVDR